MSLYEQFDGASAREDLGNSVVIAGALPRSATAQAHSKEKGERGAVMAEMAIAGAILVITILGAVKFAESMVLFRSDRAQYIYRSAVLAEPCSRPNDYKPSACS